MPGRQTDSVPLEDMARLSQKIRFAAVDTLS